MRLIFSKKNFENIELLSKEKKIIFILRNIINYSKATTIYVYFTIYLNSFLLGQVIRTEGGDLWYMC